MIGVSEASEATGTVEQKPKVQSYITTSGVCTIFFTYQNFSQCVMVISTWRQVCLHDLNERVCTEPAFIAYFVLFCTEQVEDGQERQVICQVQDV